MTTLYPPRTYKQVQNYSQQWAHYTCDCFISNTLSWNKKAKTTDYLETCMCVFYFLWRVTRSAQWPSTLSLTTLTLTQTRAARGSKPAAALLIDGRLTFGLALSQHSIGAAYCCFVETGWVSPEITNVICEMLMQSSPAWLLFFFLCCSAKITEIIWPPLCLRGVFFLPLFHRRTCSLMERMRSWGKE